MTTTEPTHATMHAYQPRFELGQIVATPGAIDACTRDHLRRCLARHLTGDWGCV